MNAFTSDNWPNLYHEWITSDKRLTCTPLKYSRKLRNYYKFTILWKVSVGNTNEKRNHQEHDQHIIVVLVFQLKVATDE